MSEFYEIIKPHLFHNIKKETDLLPFECMICYETCDLVTPIVLLPCFHVLHEECAKKTIEMAFHTSILTQSNKTVCHTWEFQCPQKDSKQSLREEGRIIKNILGRDIKPVVPRCLEIPITNIDVPYFSIPFVKEWYEIHKCKKKEFHTGNTATIIMILTQVALLFTLYHTSPSLVLCIACSLAYQLFYYISTLHSDTIAKIYLTTLTIVIGFLLVCIGLFILYCIFHFVRNNMSTIRTILYWTGIIIRCINAIYGGR